MIKNLRFNRSNIRRIYLTITFLKRSFLHCILYQCGKKLPAIKISRSTKNDPKDPARSATTPPPHSPPYPTTTSSKNITTSRYRPTTSAPSTTSSTVPSALNRPLLLLGHPNSINAQTNPPPIIAQTVPLLRPHSHSHKKSNHPQS